MGETTFKGDFMISLCDMTYSVTKSTKNAEKAVEASLKDNAELYKLLEKYDEKLKTESS